MTNETESKSRKGNTSKPDFIIRTPSFKLALGLTNEELANQVILENDLEQRVHKGLVPPCTSNKDTRRVSLNRTVMVRENVLEVDKIEKLFGSKVRHRPLGKGSYGAVTRVRDSYSGQERAMKTVHKPSVENLTRLQREILIMKRLDHPNISRLFAVYEDLTNLYFIMELCPGGELFDRIVKKGKYPEDMAARVVRQILSALAYVQANQIMHRDIKAENILYLDSREEADVKLIDWGFGAKFARGQKCSSVVGTPFYVAPEVLNGCYDYRCDNWSVGVLLYILLAGSPPFYGEDNKAILRSIRNGKYDLENRRMAKVSHEGKDLIRRLLIKDPNERMLATDAMHHPFITRHSHVPSLNPKLASFAVEKFGFFNRQPPLKRIFYTMMAHTLDHSDMESARKLFDAFDTNSDGVLTVTEVVSKLQSCGIQCGTEVYEYLETLDTDGNGTIDYTEFVASVMDHSALMKSERNTKAAFRVLDQSGDKVITAENIMAVVQERDPSSDKPPIGTLQIAENMLKVAKGGLHGPMRHAEMVAYIEKPFILNPPSRRSRSRTVDDVVDTTSGTATNRSGITNRKRSIMTSCTAIMGGCQSIA